MSKMIQIRDVSEDLHRILKARAAHEGLSLSDFLKRELTRSVGRLTMREWLERASQMKPIVGPETPAQMVRAIRGQ